MSEQFDATMKQLLDQYAIDWIEWLAPHVGLPADAEVEPFQTDLSSIKATADKVFRLKEPLEGFLHIEPQTYFERELPKRLHFYASQILYKHGGPVYSFALLLRPEANSPAITGLFEDRYDDGTVYLHFRYVPIRVWELSAETLLNGPLGSAPLALLTNEASGRLKEYVTRLDDRLEEEATPIEDRRLIHTATYILLGLRYSSVDILHAFTGVKTMRESTTYQAILQEGRHEVWCEAIVELLEDRFGPVADELKGRIQAITDMGRLKALHLEAARVTSLEEFKLS